MFVLYFSRWVVQSNASKKISLAFSRILNKLVGIPFQLVYCFSIYLFFFSHSCTTMNMMDTAPVSKFQLSFLCY